MARKLYLALAMVAMGMMFEWIRAMMWYSLGENINTGVSELKMTGSEDRVQFIITVGLEGTGHHLMKQLIEVSPNRQQLIASEIEGERSEALTGHLFHFKSEDGLWNAHCNKEEVKLAQVEAAFVGRLKKIRTHAIRARRKGIINDQILRIPLNAAPGMAPKYGMQSFPNYRGDCRKLNYPSLDLIYNACEKANVDCRHFYIYRDPIDVLISTTAKRHFNPNLQAAVHLYKSMLHVMSSQLARYRNRTLGCIGFYEDKDQWAESLRRLWGWNSREEMERAIADIYRPPSRDSALAANVTSLELAPYLKAFRDAHENAIRICQSGPNQLLNHP